MDGFERLWQQFCAERALVYGGLDDPTWRRDFRKEAAWFVLRVDAYRLNLGPVRDALAAFPLLSLVPNRHLHVVVKHVGYLSDWQVESDDITSLGLEAAAKAARAALVGVGPFTFAIAGVGALPEAVCLEVRDPRGAMADIYRRLGGAGEFLPRIDVALPTRTTEAPAGLVAAIAALREHKSGVQSCDAVELVTVDLNRPYRALTVWARVLLRG